MALRVFMVSGDASGDAHGARVAEALKKLHPEVVLEGVGGQAMAAAGVTLLADQSGMGQVGAGSIFSAPFHWWLGQKVVKHVRHNPVDVVLHIDYGVFNLWLAKQFKQASWRPSHQKAVYYIPPQVWASRPGRIQKIKAAIDHVCCIFPFEEPLYQKHGIPVTYVGHPLAGQLPPPVDKQTFCQTHNLNPEAPIVAVFPGSRVMEIDYLLTPMVQALSLLHQQREALGLPAIQPVLVQAGNLNPEQFERRWEQALTSVSKSGLGQGCPTIIRVPSSLGHAVQSVADVGLVKSGTTTLEMALYGTPMVIVYKAHPLVGWLARKIANVPCLGLPNLLVDANNPPIPELLMEEVTPQAMVSALAGGLDSNSETFQRQKQAFAHIQQGMPTGDAAFNVAQVILEHAEPQ